MHQGVELKLKKTEHGGQAIEKKSHGIQQNMKIGEQNTGDHREDERYEQQTMEN